MKKQKRGGIQSNLHSRVKKFRHLSLSPFAMEVFHQVQIANIILGRCCSYCQWHRSRDRWSDLLKIGGLMALDLQVEHAPHGSDDIRRSVLYAPEEGSRRLEIVSCH